jgi:hypothetical protein
MRNEAEHTDVLGSETCARLESDLRAALRRKPAHEARLAGTLRALAPLSQSLRRTGAAMLDAMVRRSSFERPLYASAIRTLAEAQAPAAAELISRALASEAGSLPALSAACFCGDRELKEPLLRAAVSRHAHVAFAAEVARLCRGESSGAAVASLAPKIKESHRIALCLELLVPLLSGPKLPLAIAPALSVLRDAERHLGRWLVLAEIAVRAGDAEPVEFAGGRAAKGPLSARAAWSMVAWALAPDGEPPKVRPTVELVARLSDRPSADKDTTFLFRLAQARVPSARSMLESMARSALLGDESSIRAMLHLVRDYGQERYRVTLSQIASQPRRDPLRALAAAALFDIGDASAATRAAAALDGSRHLSALAWASLVRVASTNGAIFGGIMTEARYRRLQLGWVE